MAVTFTSSGYDTIPGNGLDEVKWSRMLPRVGSSTYGVRGTGDWKVTGVAGTPFTVAIAPGMGWGHGVMDETTVQDTITVPTVASGTRWDFIACRRDWKPTGGGPSAFTAITNSGSQIPASKKSAPGDEDDQPLALVQWTAGQTQPTKIIDLRCWAGNGGMVAMDEMVLSYLGRPGAEVRIGNSRWTYDIGANYVAEWNAEVGVSHTVLNSSLQMLDTITGLSIVSTNTFGDATIPVTSFLSQIKSVQLLDATDPKSLGAITFKWTAATTTATKITFRAYGTTGPLKSASIAVAWTAHGV